VAKEAAGLVVYRGDASALEVLLVHPGGPYFARKDLGAWTIPKGEPSPGEDPLVTARRELLEETGFAAEGEPLALTPVRQACGKLVRAWAVRGDFDVAALRSNAFTLEWPPKSGRQQEFPEVDRAAWLPLEEARRRINPAQSALLDELAVLVAARPEQ
jgi:predicted NUDIX family NTP pyrophosphohydrolase